MHSPSEQPCPRRRRGGLRLAIAAVLAALFAAAVTAGPTRAASISDWEGVDPKATTCNGDAATVESADITFNGHRLGTVELRHSNRCRTAWARLTNEMTHVPGDAHSGFADVVRDSDGLTFTCHNPPGDDTVCWTAMINDSGVTAHAYGNIDPYPTHGNGTAEARTKSS